MHTNKTMKVIKAFGPQDLRIAEAPIPEPKPGHVRIRVRASGICGSDKWIWNVKGETENIAGHEVAGEVDALGAGVFGLAVGDRVMVNNVVGCGECPECRAGAFVLCPGWNGMNDVNNGFGEYVVAPERNCMRLLPGLDFIDGALIMDNWGTPFGGIKRAKIQPGMDVLVLGCGPIGQAAIGLCRANGAYVMACDPIPFRREMALKNGATKVFKPEDLPKAAKDANKGAGVHVVMECSGCGPAYDTAMQCLRIGGNLVAIGEHAEFTFNSTDHAVRRSLSITGSWYATMPQAAEVMFLAQIGRIQLKSFLTHTVKLEDVPKMFKSIMELDEGILKCVITM